jgi:glutathione peroxidase-family protein
VAQLRCKSSKGHIRAAVVISKQSGAVLFVTDTASNCGERYHGAAVQALFTNNKERERVKGLNTQ